MFYISYYLAISISLLGYGFILSKLLKINFLNFGFLGLIGISFLIFISYISTLFFAHDYFFNIVVHLIGIFSFIFFFKGKYKKDLIQHLAIFAILIIFILVAKNHDDFPYYHYPYSFFLTQYEHPIGFGQLNPGFRNHSSLFFLNSLFYLPKIDHFLLNISPVYFLGFANLVFYNFIFYKNNFNNYKFINFQSLLSLSFINVFFYRLAEHGTDRSGQILIFIIIILLVMILNSSRDLYYKRNKNLFNLSLILLILLVSLKPFYLIYLPILLITFSVKIFRENIIKLFLSSVTLYSFILLFFVFFFNFLNSGCLIYPAFFTCFENLQWSFSENTIRDVNQWYELWSKAGASPNYKIANASEYIANFNWVSNWIENYFFNKISDFLLGLFLLIIVFWILFILKTKNNVNSKKFEFKLIYIYLLICFFEWFLKHPALRYGGYQLFALILFFPLIVKFNKLQINYNTFYNKSWIVILIVLTIFLSRNVNRIIKENSQYNYNPFISTSYLYHGGDEKFYNRYINYFNSNYNNFGKINILGKKFVIIK